MNCPKCKLPTVKLGEVECKTGNAEKRGCPRCKGIWYQQSGYVPNFAEWTPLRQSLERLVRLAVAEEVMA